MLYTNYETKKLVEEILDKADLFTDSQTYREENGNFTAESMQEFLRDNIYCNRYDDIADFQQIAEEINKS